MKKDANKKIRVLVLLSGGLDSMLAARLLLEQGVEVAGITFTSYFFGATRARLAAEQLDIELIEYDFKDEHLAMVKKPAHGYGSNMNPCIDCHGLMLSKAREYLAPSLSLPAPPRSSGTPSYKGGEKFDFIATGEVLGQRPMSQNRQALAQVEKISGLTGRLLRPLSAKLLPLTKPEKEGKIEREKLLDISGRSRQRQIELAAKFGLKDYPSPAGGCLLTDPSFSQRLKILFEFWPDCGGGDVELLKYGRVHWLSRWGKKVMVVIGRNREDNERLTKLARAGDVMMELKDAMGPTTLLRNFKFSIFNFQTNPRLASTCDSESRWAKFLEVEVPLELSEKIFKNKNSVEIAAVLTGYYAPKMRGRCAIVSVKK